MLAAVRWKISSRALFCCRRTRLKTDFPREDTLGRYAKWMRVVLALVLSAGALAQQKPFPVVSTMDEPTIAGRPVQLDAEGKLLPWPMPDNIGFSYSSDVLTQ